MNQQAAEEKQYQYSGGDFNFYSQPTPQQPEYLGQQSNPQYPQAAQASTLSPPNQYAFSGSAGSNVAFDNVDISRSNSNRFSGGTPFETVHEFVSVSNKVRRGILF